MNSSPPLPRFLPCEEEVELGSLQNSLIAYFGLNVPMNSTSKYG